MRVPNCVSEFLQVSVLTSFEVLVELWLVVSIFYAEVNDLSCCLCISQIESRCEVELNVMSRTVFASVKHVSLHIEDLRGESSWRRYAVLQL